MCFTVYIICAIALAGLVDPNYAANDDQKNVEIKSKKTSKLVGVDDLKPEQVLSGKEGIGNTKWILVKVATFGSQKHPIYVIEAKDNPELIWATKSESCEDPEIMLVNKPQVIQKSQRFPMITKNQTSKIYSEQCGKDNCVSIDETSMEINLNSGCYGDIEFNVIEN
ncbi:uncharacterized protein LOC126888806 [Diabrotica virgifera virgifera]|uniref:Uncharacterized protein n=1 Tax=Diabrotica virgifera virgifera TaxID=50390 RepID=A0ABM5KSI5_DIAVI|nr:uncharacterized protein LOC126888806 [Diabrotica virgifera virgifera]